MATSGTIVTTTTAREIIQEALELMGALGEGELANTAQETSLGRTLRNLCITWQADGLNLFAVTSLLLFPVPGKPNYRIGDNTTFTAKRHARNRLLAEAPATTNILLCDTLPEDTSFEACGVALSTGKMHWSYVTAYNDLAITLQDPLPEDALAGAIIYQVDLSTDHRFMKALHGSYLGPGDVSIPMEAMSRNEYDTLTRKDSKGIPLQYYVDTQALYNDIYIWPTTSHLNQIVRFDVQRQLDTLTSVTEDVAFPAEWFLPLATNLAHVSAAKYGLPPDDDRRLRLLAEKYYDMANDFDFEWGTSIYMQPER